MSKGTPSFFGGKKTHIICRRCGRRTYHASHRRCASCGFPDAKLRKYAWSKATHKAGAWPRGH